MKQIVLSSLVLLWLAAAPAVAQPQPDPLDEVRTLYDAADYEDALAKLSGVGDAPTARAEQYRAFCLFALGRTDEAVASVARAVSADPLWMPTAGDASPRVQAFYAEERRKLLPDIIRSAYTQARAAYAAQKYTDAIAGFTRVKQLAASGGQEPGSPVADLLMLSDDFLKLAQNGASAAAAAPPSVPGAPSASATSSATSSAPASQPRPAATQPAALAPALETRPPVAISQKLPLWTNATWRGNRDGQVHVEIDETGAVTKATIVRLTDPQYDAQLLEAARGWRYDPALRLGRPIASSKDINYVLKSSR